MRDIQMVLERWGAWVANNHEDVTWSSIAAGFKGLIPSKVKSRPQCCDDDAMIICGCMARLKKNNSDLHDLLVDYYVGGESRGCRERSARPSQRVYFSAFPGYSPPLAIVRSYTQIKDRF